MKILAIDTALGASSACIFDAAAGVALAQETLAQSRGHDETIAPLISRVFFAVGGPDFAVDRVAATVGPGSFTGLRIGLASARAIGLARNVPVVGVSTLAAYAAPAIVAFPDSPVIAAIDARHGRLFIAAYVRGKNVIAPRLWTAREAARAFGGEGPLKLVGPAAAGLAIEAWSMGLEADVLNDAPAPDIAFVARLGAAVDPAAAPPRPLYLNAPSTTLAPADPAPRAP
jgi:tRNA threonylcarbamoyl adenosine modification protein YeaZ